MLSGRANPAAGQPAAVPLVGAAVAGRSVGEGGNVVGGRVGTADVAVGGSVVGAGTVGDGGTGDAVGRSDEGVTRGVGSGAKGLPMHPLTSPPIRSSSPPRFSHRKNRANRLAPPQASA